MVIGFIGFQQIVVCVCTCITQPEICCVCVQASETILLDMDIWLKNLFFMFVLNCDFPCA